MSGIMQIVGQSSGVSHLLGVDSGGKLLCGDSALLSKNTEILAKNTEIETSCDAILAKNTEILAKNTELEVTADAILAKNTEILAKNTEIETSCDALILANHTDLVAINSTLGGTLSVSAPAISASSSVLVNAVSVVSGTTHTSSSVDLNTARSVMVMGNLADTGGSIKVLVSVDDSTYYENSEQTIFSSSNGDFAKSMNVDARYLKFSYANSSGSAQTFTLISSFKA